MLFYVLVSVAILVVALVAVIALQPSSFRITRSATISAPPATVFPHVNDLRSWEAWSPWAKLDPEMKQTYAGPQEGVGASHAWVGNSNVGEGRMTITESRPSERIRMRLEFLRPFACTNDVEFHFQAEGQHTVVTWTMTGPKNFMAKGMHLVMNVDKMCGDQFEKGLASLDEAVKAVRSGAA